jgi:hypothetical protein
MATKLRGAPVLLAALMLTAPASYGQDSACDAPMWLPDKPQLDQYAEYSLFLADIMAYKAKKRKIATHKKDCPELYKPRAISSSDPTVIDGPETLGGALQRAQRIPEIDYSRNQTWYNRTTSRSFGLPSLSGDELSDNTVAADLTALKPDATPREGAQLLTGIFSESLNDKLFSGAASQDLAAFQFETNLFEREQEADMAGATQGFMESFSAFFAIPSGPGGDLVLYLDEGGIPIKGSSTAYVQNCLSSCL